MATFYDGIDDKLHDFIQDQKIFFVATAAQDGRINLSPKGYRSLVVLDPNRVLWLNLTGSGNETAAHLRAANRMTIMFCAFEGPPRILRFYGRATTIHPRDDSWNELIGHFDDLAGARQIFDMRIESVQTSCGFGVPLLEFTSDRDTLIDKTEQLGDEGLREYWQAKNVSSIDGLPTNIFED